MSAEVNVDRIVGRLVRDADGARAGRIADFVTRKDGDDLVVSTYIIGPRAWIHRFAIHGLGWRTRGIAWFYSVNWDQMDLSDPFRPRLTCRCDELTIDHMPPRKRGLGRRKGRRL
jgi:hypothetical protein